MPNAEIIPLFFVILSIGSGNAPIVAELRKLKVPYSLSVRCPLVKRTLSYNEDMFKGTGGVQIPRSADLGTLVMGFYLGLDRNEGI